MKKLSLFNFCLLHLAISSWSQSSLLQIPATNGNIEIRPILHATMVITYDDFVIYTDPYGGAKAFEGVQAPDLVLITDIHGDHMNLETLNALNLQSVPIVAPRAVVDQLEGFTKTIVLSNGQKKSFEDLLIEAIPMYNLPETDDSRHPKGRGNGYIITLGGKRIYVSGDTEDIAEMRSLKNIDVAFVCMNQPYTMTVEDAASAVLDFEPTIVFPFHYRGQGGFSDVDAFKRIVNESNPSIEVRLVDWYKE